MKGVVSIGLRNNSRIPGARGFQERAVRLADAPAFIDGGSMIAPRGGFFSSDRKWAVENEGGTGCRCGELAQGCHRGPRSTTGARGAGSDAHAQGTPGQQDDERTSSPNLGQAQGPFPSYFASRSKFLVTENRVWPLGDWTTCAKAAFPSMEKAITVILPSSEFPAPPASN